MKVALVHDWLTGMRGGEAVLEGLCALLPGAPIYTLVHVPGAVSPAIERGREIRASFVSRLPLARTRYRSYLPLFPRAIESLDVTGFDLVVSTSHCVAKGARARAGARHVCYCHTPVRYAWDRFDDYFGPRSGAGLAKRAIARVVCRRLRAWDVATAPRVDRFVANSAFVAGRIRRFYGREAEVLPPPVDCARFAPDPRGPGDYYLAVAALAPYKRLDHAIEACAMLGRRLVVAGWGPERARLERLARRFGARVDLLGRVPGEALPELYARCLAFLMPGVEDFGITPLEALASGRPVVALAEGGARETVGEDAAAPAGSTPFGELYDDPTPAGLAAAIERIERRLDALDPAALRARALAFDRPVFESRLRDLLASEGVPLDGGAPCERGACGAARPC